MARFCDGKFAFCSLLDKRTGIPHLRFGLADGASEQQGQVPMREWTALTVCAT